MSIKYEQVSGQKAGGFMSTRPVMHCDTKDCTSELPGNAGGEEEMLRGRANSLGWKHDTDKNTDACKGCDEASAAAEPAAKK